MQYARIGTNGDEVDADSAPFRRDYRCPTCGARVTLKHGSTYAPHFAHYPNEGSAKCEEYFPGKHGNGPGSKKKRDVESAPDESGLCVDDSLDPWRLFLRVPEIGSKELGARRADELLKGTIEVVAGATAVAKLTGWDIRPRVGSARVFVPPSTGGYRLRPTGQWPPGVATDRWAENVGGLNPAGTLFRLKAGEWVRLRPQSLVRWGEALVAVAARQHAPPASCVLGAGMPGLPPADSWELWRLAIPETPDPRVATWLRGLRHSVEPPTWEIRFESWPCGIGADESTPQFPSGTPILLQLQSPAPGATATAELTVTPCETLESITSAHSGTRVYAGIKAKGEGPGRLRVAAEEEVDAMFEIVQLPSALELATEIQNRPRLRLQFGKKEIAFGGANLDSLTRAEAQGSVKVTPGAEGARVDIVATGRGTRKLWVAVTSREAESVLEQLTGEAWVERIRVDAGALGKLALQFRQAVPQRANGSPRERTLGWLRTVMIGGGETRALAPFVLRGIDATPGMRAFNRFGGRKSMAGASFVARKLLQVGK